MNVAVFSTKPYDRQFLEEANAPYGYRLTFLEPRLTEETSPLAFGHDAVCAFVNDELNERILTILKAGRTQLIALRCAGFNNVDLRAAPALDLTVLRVPAYSPYAVAEHTLALVLGLNRQLHRAHNRVREGNFALNGLLGFDLHGRTVGVIGTGKIGLAVIRIFRGFGCRVLAHDPYPSQAARDLGAEYRPLAEMLPEADIVTLHCPLTPDTHHLINAGTVAQLKPGCMVINTSRGALIDTQAVIDGLKNGQVGYLGLDVYEEEADLFFEDLSNQIIQDDAFTRLLTFPNVLITGHQAFFTAEALRQIAATTLANISAFATGTIRPENLVSPEHFVRP